MAPREPATDSAGTALSPRGVGSADREFRVLSLDGGGYRGIFTLEYLRRLEERCEKPLIDYFNLVCGTSVGSIIALSLASGRSAAETLDALDSLSSVVFAPERSRRPWWRTLRHARYDVSSLHRALVDFFGDETLASVRVPVCIPSVRLIDGSPRVFKSAHDCRFQVDQHYLLADVALASAAAPTYFAPAAVPSPGGFVDGGLWANNPALVGVVEAVDLGTPLASIRVLSIGTGEALVRPLGTQSGREELARGGLLAWKSDLVPLVMRGQSASASNMVGKLIGTDRYLRVNAAVHADDAAFDALQTRDNLEAYAETRFMETVDTVLGAFLKVAVEGCSVRDTLSASGSNS